MSEPKNKYFDKPKPSTQHPFMGARLELLVYMWFASGGVSPKVFPLFMLMLLSAAGRLPFRALESIQFKSQRRRKAYETPVFIIGHWRSGTTHLHNLLGKAPHFAHISPTASGLPDELLTLGSWFRPLIDKALPEDRNVDKVAVTPDSPQEDEIPLANMQTLSIYHGLYFPKHFHKHMTDGISFDKVSPARAERRKRHMQRFLSKIACQQNKPCVLVKNPVYTVRPSYLRAIWPDCKIIYIERDPYRVFQSTVHYYRKMLPQLALQRFDHIDIPAFVIEKYEKTLTGFYSDPFDRSPGNFAEVNYEVLAENPMAEIERIYTQLALPEWENAEPAISRYMATVKDYPMNELSMPDKDKASVDAAVERINKIKSAESC